MDDIEIVQACRMAVLVIWLAVFLSTGPFLFMAAHTHQRSTLMTVALLGFFGLVLSVVSYDSARTATQMYRPVRLWIDYYAGTVAMLLMALTLGWRTWRVMFGRPQ